MDHAERKDLTEQAFTGALAGDLDKAGAVLERIAQGSTSVQMYAVCCAFATAGAHALRKMFAAQGMTSRDLVFLKPSPDDATDSPARTFARRFIVAHTNRDHPMTKALFIAALEASGRQFEASVSALLIEAADMHAAVCQAHER